MSYLNDNQKLTFKKFLISTAVVSLLMCSSAETFAMITADDSEQLPDGPFLIKNIRHQEFLNVSDKHNVAGSHRAVLGMPHISNESIFIAEKGREGTRIKNVKSNTYLFASGSKVFWGAGESYTASNKSSQASSYYEIYKRPEGFVIRNKSCSEFICLSDWKSLMNLNHPRYVLSSSKDNNPMMYFSFQVYNGALEQ